MAFLEKLEMAIKMKKLLKGAMGSLKMLNSLLILFLILFSSNAPAYESLVTSEDELKTAFIYQFTKYVKWPDSKKNKQEVVIGVIANDDTFKAISRLNGRLSQGARITVVPVKDISQLKNIDILYLEKGHIADDIISEAVKHHILTISDEEDATDKGVIITLFMADSRLRFNINLKVAKQSHLKFSSRLLSLANTIIR